MRNLRFTGAVALASAAAVALGACGSSDDTSSSTAATSARVEAGARSARRDSAGVTVGFAGLWNANPTVKQSQDAWQAAIKARGGTPTLLQADPRDPVNTLITNMDQLTSQRVRASGFYPIDPNALSAPTRRALDAGIPVFAFEESRTPATQSIHLGREVAARLVARALCGKFPDGGKVIYGGYGQPDLTLTTYQRNVIAEIEACSGGKLEVAATFDNRTDDVAGALAPANAALQRVPDADAIVAYSDVTAIGASRAATQLGRRDQLTIIGFNLAQDGIDAVENGQLDYSLLFPVTLMSQYVANSQLDLVGGRRVARFATFWPQCYGKQTIDELPSPADQLAAVAEGRSLLVDPEVQVSESNSEMVRTPPSTLTECPL